MSKYWFHKTGKKKTISVFQILTRDEAQFKKKTISVFQILTRDEAQFERFSYILSNGYR